MRLFRHPVLCNYYLTYRCNARCAFCDIWEKPSPYVSTAHVLRNLIDLKKLGVRVVDFTGGEPLLHRDVAMFCRMARNLGFITTVTSNGLLYHKHAQALKGQVSMLHFSLDAYEADAHNASRGVACYDHLMRGLDLALQLRERPDVLFTVKDENIADIAPIYERITRPRGLILILNPIFEYAGVGSALSTGHFQELRRWARRPNVYLNEGFLRLREAGGNDISKPVCVAASSTVVISPENELVLPCYHLQKAGFPIENRLYELWRSTDVQSRLKWEGRLPECQGCAINCYMQPSFAFQLNPYFLHAMPSTFKYALEKWAPARL